MSNFFGTSTNNRVFFSKNLKGFAAQDDTNLEDTITEIVTQQLQSQIAAQTSGFVTAGEAIDLLGNPLTNATILDSTLNNSPIGSTTPSSANFTNLSTTGTVQFQGSVGNFNWDSSSSSLSAGQNIQVGDLTLTGTNINSSSSLGIVAPNTITLNASTLNFNGTVPTFNANQLTVGSLMLSTNVFQSIGNQDLIVSTPSGRFINLNSPIRVQGTGGGGFINNTPIGNGGASSATFTSASLPILNFNSPITDVNQIVVPSALFGAFKITDDTGTQNYVQIDTNSNTITINDNLVVSGTLTLAVLDSNILRNPPPGNPLLIEAISNDIQISTDTGGIGGGITLQTPTTGATNFICLTSRSVTIDGSAGINIGNSGSGPATLDSSDTVFIGTNAANGVGVGDSAAGLVTIDSSDAVNIGASATNGITLSAPTTSVSSLTTSGGVVFSSVTGLLQDDVNFVYTAAGTGTLRVNGITSRSGFPLAIATPSNENISIVPSGVGTLTIGGSTNGTMTIDSGTSIVLGTNAGTSGIILNNATTVPMLSVPNGIVFANIGGTLMDDSDLVYDPTTKTLQTNFISSLSGNVLNISSNANANVQISSGTGILFLGSPTNGNVIIDSAGNVCIGKNALNVFIKGEIFSDEFSANVINVELAIASNIIVENNIHIENELFANVITSNLFINANIIDANIVNVNEIDANIIDVIEINTNTINANIIDVIEIDANIINANIICVQDEIKTNIIDANIIDVNIVCVQDEIKTNTITNVAIGGNVNIFADGNLIMDANNIILENTTFVSDLTANGGVVFANITGQLLDDPAFIFVQANGQLNSTAFNASLNYQVDNIQIIGPQEPSVANAAAATATSLVDLTTGTAGTTIILIGDTTLVNQGPTLNDNLASLTDEVNKIITDIAEIRTQLNVLLSRLRASSGHGLIA